MVKHRLSALFLTLTLLLCSLPVSAAEGDDWLVPKAQEAPVFIDMAGVWCEDYVETVCAAGLMQGRTAERFDAVSQLTLAQITVIGARLYNLLTGGDGDIESVPGAPWYQGSYDLLVEAGVLTEEFQAGSILHWYDFSADDPCRRSFFVELLGAVLEQSGTELPELNVVTLIPDVQVDRTGYTYTYTFYRAGLLNGSDPYGGFHGTAYLTRGQAAAILARLVDPTQRLEFELPAFDICTDLFGVEHGDVLLTVDGINITAEQMGGTLVRCLFYLSPEEGLNDAITQAKETIAARRLMEELGYTIDQGQLAEAEEFAQERSGLYGITANGFLWESMRGLYESALHPYILRKYGDKNYLSGMEQELREKVQTLTVAPSEILTSLNLDAIKAKSENAPIYWS